MAMKAMRCTQCGAELELDDAKEFGFCSSCGTKVMLHETVEMKHTGDVRMKMDNSEQGQNRIALGHRAYAGGNYQEAYKYYTQGLEDVPDDLTAIYRKGICAVVLSPEDNLRLPELRATAGEVSVVLSKTLNDVENDEEQAETAEYIEQFDEDMKTLGESALTGTNEYYNRLANMEKSNTQAAIWCENAKLLNLVTDAIVYEENCETLLENAIKRCDEWLGYDKLGKISYYTNTTTDKKGKTKDHYTVYRMGDARRQIIERARAEMAERFNNLPTRIQRAKDMSDALGSLQEETEKLRSARDQAQSAFDSAKEAFWNANPELTARRNKSKNLSWISVGIGAVVLIISLVLKSTSIAIPAAGVVAFAASFYLRSKMVKGSLAKLEKEVFPSDVKALSEALDTAKSEWFQKERARRETEGKISSFEASKK